MLLKKDKSSSSAGENMRRLEDMAGENDTFISGGAKLKGVFSGKDGLRIKGFVDGEIDIEGILRVEDGGEIKGTVHARGVIVSGKIEGTIKAENGVEIRATGKVTGDVHCAKIALEEGCFFQGEIKMNNDKSEPVKFKEKRNNKNEDSNKSGENGIEVQRY